MKAYNDKTFVVGNIGIPYTSLSDQSSADSVTVAEISSFQLETIHTFRPHVSAILNITPDHLNRHHTMEAYVNAKKNIAKNQTEQPDLIIMDVMMPDCNGLIATIKIREMSNVPVLMLSAKAEGSDRILGLEVGADDYLIKPFMKQ